MWQVPHRSIAVCCMPGAASSLAGVQIVCPTTGGCSHATPSSYICTSGAVVFDGHNTAAKLQALKEPLKQDGRTSCKITVCILDDGGLLLCILLPDCLTNS